LGKAYTYLRTIAMLQTCSRGWRIGKRLLFLSSHVTTGRPRVLPAQQVCYRLFCTANLDRVRFTLADDPFPNASEEHRMLLANALTQNDMQGIINLAESGVGCAMGFLGMAYRDGNCGMY